jgi:hypothetical protein
MSDREVWTYQFRELDSRGTIVADLGTLHFDHRLSSDECEELMRFMFAKFETWIMMLSPEPAELMAKP